MRYTDNFMDYFNRTNKMIKGGLCLFGLIFGSIVILIVFSIIFDVTMNITGKNKIEAEIQAKRYISEIYPDKELIAVSCQNNDTNSDGYVSCTAKFKDGAKSYIECNGYCITNNCGCRERIINFGNNQ